jgi:hypothetical protein
MVYFNDVLKLLKQIQVDQTGQDLINKFIQEAQDFANLYPNASQSLKDDFIVYYASARFLKANNLSDSSISDKLMHLYVKLIQA